MSKQKKYYKVTYGCSSCIWETLKDAQQMVIDETEILLSMEQDVEDNYFTIEKVFMTKEEYDSLPEFDGGW